MTESPEHNRRKRVLIKPELQWSMVATCSLVVLAALLVQGAVLTFTLHQVADTLPTEGLLVLEAVPSVLTTSILTTLALLAPLVLALGLRYSHRIAGPLHRIEQTLLAVQRGEPRRVGSLRKGDQLVELAALVDHALELPSLPRESTGVEAGPQPAAPLPSDAERNADELVDGSR